MASTAARAVSLARPDASTAMDASTSTVPSPVSTVTSCSTAVEDPATTPSTTCWAASRIGERGA